MTDDRPANGGIDREHDTGTHRENSVTAREKRIDRSRRNVLRAGATVAGVLALGGAATNGASALRATGGSALTPKDGYRRGIPFRIASEPISPPLGAFPASCYADESELREYLIFQFVYDDGSATASDMAVRSNKADDIAMGDRFEFTTAPSKECEFFPIPIVRATYRPLR